jgi:FtsP/CotA-like multicopper oxidase with cupredoxin domain
MVGSSASVLAGAALAMGQDRIDPAGARSVPEGSGPYAPGEPNRDYVPVYTPNGVTLPFRVVGGVKVFHLVAEEFEHEFLPGLKAKCWGYNGRTPGPTIEAVEGDRVRIYVTNRLPEPTTVHWHGIILPSGMDGVSGLSQPPIPVGETFVYEFTLRQYGTFMYHSHYDEMVQIGLGMMGMFVIHPRGEEARRGRRVDRDFCIMLHEWKVDPGAARPDPMEMTDFNLLTMNSKAFPGTAPLVARLGQKVRVRLGNLSPMDHHPIHIHGYNWRVTGTDGGPIPPGAQVPETSVLVPVGATRDVEITADNPGDWAIHCHMTHHTMNQMGHGLPNVIGADMAGFDDRMKKLLPGYMTMGEKGMGEMGQHMAHMPLPKNSAPMRGGEGPFGFIDMGGMFTILKVREGEVGFEDPGWYRHPEGTVSRTARAEELRRDGIDAGVRPAPATTTAAVFTCRHHPEVRSDKPGKCPKCNMTLTPMK